MRLVCCEQKTNQIIGISGVMSNALDNHTPEIMHKGKSLLFQNVESKTLRIIEGINYNDINSFITEPVIT